MRIMTTIAIVLSYIASILISICLIVLCCSFLKDLFGERAAKFFGGLKKKISFNGPFVHRKVVP